MYMVEKAIRKGERKNMNCYQIGELAKFLLDFTIDRSI